LPNIYSHLLGFILWNVRKYETDEHERVYIFTI